MAKDSQGDIVATDAGAATSDSFVPGANAQEWIEQLARPYRERPWAVIRELFQNASDAMVMRDGGADGQIELALLSSDPTELEHRYHLVVRDAGTGMTDETFCSNVGILGVGSKKDNQETIGQFGVGFFATHAICMEVVVLSRPLGSDQVTAWQYVPQFKKFFRPPDNVVQDLMSRDFDNHPIAARRRRFGTSVYLNLDLTNHPLCEKWLVAEELLREVQRDFFILRFPVYLANLCDPSSPSPIYGANKQDVTGQQLSLDTAPWDLSGAQQQAAAIELLRSQRPHTKSDADLPAEWACFS